MVSLEMPPKRIGRTGGGNMPDLVKLLKQWAVVRFAPIAFTITGSLARPIGDVKRKLVVRAPS